MSLILLVIIRLNILYSFNVSTRKKDCIPQCIKTLIHRFHSEQICSKYSLKTACFPLNKYIRKYASVKSHSLITDLNFLKPEFADNA